MTEGKSIWKEMISRELEPKKPEVTSAWCFSYASLFSLTLPVEQNVAFGLKIPETAEKEIYQRVQEMLEIVGLE